MHLHMHTEYHKIDQKKKVTRIASIVTKADNNSAHRTPSLTYSTITTLRNFVLQDVLCVFASSLQLQA